MKTKGRLIWKNIFFICFLLICIYGIGRIYFRLTDDFRIANITYDIPFNPGWEIPQPSAEEQKVLDNILNQPFYYLGKGAQSYAFGSEDKKYVLKFFKVKHHKPNWKIKIIPPISYFDSYRERQLAKHQRKLLSAFEGYKLAYDENKSNGIIVWMHLNRTNNFSGIITVRDKLGFKREINLDTVYFILQERAVPAQDLLTNLLKADNLIMAKRRLNQLLELSLSEYEKGIYDRDRCLMKNMGFIEERPVHYDLGKLTKEERMKSADYQAKELLQVTKKINKWIQINFPQYYKEVSDSLDHHISSLVEKT